MVGFKMFLIKIPVVSEVSQSPFHTGWILMKLRMEIPVCLIKIEHRSKVKVTENTETTIWGITFEPEVLETYGWFQNVPDQNTYQKCQVPMTYVVPFLCHLTKKIHNYCIFSNFVNFVRIDLKIGTHID